MNELVKQEMHAAGDLPATAGEIRAQVNLIQTVMKDVMKEGTHYGKIPGCGDDPTLLKAGAEKIMATFRLAADPDINDLSSADEARYRVKVNMSSPSGVFVGAGIGECSSDEEKYKWRKTICNEEFEETADDRKRSVWKRGWQNKPNYQVKQVRTNVADVRNTILKMAKKRALVDAVLTATAASDIFTQDIEDLPEGYLDNADATPPGVKDIERSDDPRTPALTKSLETEAHKGWDALQKKWGSLTTEDRTIIGADFGRIKAIAESA